MHTLTAAACSSSTFFSVLPNLEYNFPIVVRIVVESLPPTVRPLVESVSYMMGITSIAEIVYETYPAVDLRSGY